MPLVVKNFPLCVDCDGKPSTDATEAEVTLPFASIANIGICDEDPYVLADTPEFARVEEILTLALPSKLADPLTSPDRAIALEFVNVAADPVVLALMVVGRLIVTAPLDALTSTSFAVPVKDVTPPPAYDNEFHAVEPFPNLNLPVSYSIPISP